MPFDSKRSTFDTQSLAFEAIKLTLDSIDPYPEGEWMQLEVKQDLFTESSTSVDNNLSDDEEEGKKVVSPDRILRGPIWDYSAWGYGSPCHYDLLYGKPKKTVFTKDELIVKGPEWTPSKAVTTSLATYLFKRLGKADPESTALLEVETGRTLTYKELIEKARSLASGLRWIGISPGQVIAVVSFNSLEAQIMVLASILNGTITALVDPSLNPGDIGIKLRIASPRLIFSECGKTLLKVETAMTYLTTSRMPQVVVNNYKGLNHHMQSGYHFTFTQLLVEVEKPFKPAYSVYDSKNPIFILFTSGTTGTPKGALISERLYMQSKLFLESDFKGATFTYTNLVAAPLMWISMVSSTLLHLSGGHRTVFFRGPPSEAVLIQTLRKFKVVYWLTSTATIMRLLNWPVKPRCISLKTVLVSGSVISAENLNKVKDSVFEGKVNLYQIYGLTETAVVTSNSAVANKIGSIGRVFYNVQMKVVEVGTNIALGPCSEGELCFKLNNMMLGYYQNPSATKEVFDEEGFFHSGDIGYYDEQGFVYFTGRIKDLIKWNSYQISPAEIELKLKMHPAIKDAVVFGLYTESQSELVTAAVVLNDGFEDTSTNLLLSLINEELSDSKRIRGGIHVFKKLHYTLTEKVMRATVRNEVIERINNSLME